MWRRGQLLRLDKLMRIFRGGRGLVEVTAIKADLPNWPDEVIEHWLLKLANRGPDTGWPPPEPLGNHAWKYILGNRPLSWWKNVTWQLEKRDVNFKILCQASRRIVNEMLDAHINHVANIYSRMPDSKTRFESAARYIAQNGTYPKQLVAMQLGDGLSVIDGNHRMTALCYCKATEEEVLKAGGLTPLNSHAVWIGTHSLGEVPN
jgi:hypothetical protein